jgi:hypothetical protein
MHDTAPTRRIRRDGWTVARQVKFIVALNATGSVKRAAAAAGMSRESAYRLRERPGHEDFARTWDLAVAAKGHRPQDESHTPSAQGHKGHAPAAARPSLEGHESHGPDDFARGCSNRQLRGGFSGSSSGRVSAGAAPWTPR